MSRIRISAAVLSAALAVGVTAASAASHATKLQAFVKDPASIGLTMGGKKVSSLKAGKYTIVVKDTAADHNFHLSGPGVNKLTDIGKKQTVTWTVTLKKGTYKFVCDPHASFMKGSFKVK